MGRSLVKRDSDGKTVDLEKQDAEQDELDVGAKNVLDKALKTRIDYSGNNPIYVGYANSGASTSESSWRILKLDYSGNNVISIDYAQSTTDFVSIWVDRASYSYG